MSLTVGVLSVKQPRSYCSQTVKTYGTKTTELSQWTISKTSLKTLIGFYKKHPTLHSVCVFMCQSQIFMKFVCAFVSVNTIKFLSVCSLWLFVCVCVPVLESCYAFFLFEITFSCFTASIRPTLSSSVYPLSHTPSLIHAPSLFVTHFLTH